MNITEVQASELKVNDTIEIRKQRYRVAKVTSTLRGVDIECVRSDSFERQLPEIFPLSATTMIKKVVQNGKGIR